MVWLESVGRELIHRSLLGNHQSRIRIGQPKPKKNENVSWQHRNVRRSRFRHPLDRSANRNRGRTIICSRRFGIATSQNLRLLLVAIFHLRPVERSTKEDVALSALNAFFCKVGSGQLSRVADRGQLWALLTTIATHKAINVRRKSAAKKRGGGIIHGDFSSDEFRNLAMADPGPQELAEFRELVNRHVGATRANAEEGSRTAS